jgi:hypothetical protein
LITLSAFQIVKEQCTKLPKRNTERSERWFSR